MGIYCIFQRKYAPRYPAGDVSEQSDQETTKSEETLVKMEYALFFTKRSPVKCLL